MVSVKKKTLEHPKSCPLKRAKYLSKLNDYIAQGYASIGKSCIDRYNWQSKKSTNVIGAFYEKMLFALGYFEQNINSHIFYDWCKNTLIPCLKTKCVIVMDNASFHKRVQRLLNRHGHCLLFLPPYSSDLNPIEKKWPQAKFVRQG